MPRKLGPPPEERQKAAPQSAAAGDRTTTKEIRIPAPADGQELDVSIRRIGSGSVVRTSVHDRDNFTEINRTEKIVDGPVEIKITEGDNE